MKKVNSKLIDGVPLPSLSLSFCSSLSVSPSYLLIVPLLHSLIDLFNIILSCTAATGIVEVVTDEDWLNDKVKGEI